MHIFLIIFLFALGVLHRKHFTIAISNHPINWRKRAFSKLFINFIKLFQLVERNFACDSLLEFSQVIVIGIKIFNFVTILNSKLSLLVMLLFPIDDIFDIQLDHIFGVGIMKILKIFSLFVIYFSNRYAFSQDMYMVQLVLEKMTPYCSKSIANILIVILILRWLYHI